MRVMTGRVFFILPIILFAINGTANAGWQYGGTYLGDGVYKDDGSRFVLSLRGGASFGTGKIKNKVGALTTGYWYNTESDVVVSDAYYEVYEANGGDTSSFVNAGIGSLSTLPAKKDFEALSFTAGASIGWTIPNHPQFRLETGWDHMSESDYNVSPLFEGELSLTGGDIAGLNCDYIGLEEESATYQNINRIHENNKKVLVWTVNSEESQKHFLLTEVDGIITDNVKQANTIRDQLKQRDDLIRLYDFILDLLR